MKRRSFLGLILFGAPLAAFAPKPEAAEPIEVEYPETKVDWTALHDTLYGRPTINLRIRGSGSINVDDLADQLTQSIVDGGARKA